MLSSKFILLVLVVVVLVFGLSFFPSFQSSYRSLNTVGLDTEMLGIHRLFPYFLFFVIFYAAYIVWRKGKGG